MVERLQGDEGTLIEYALMLGLLGEDNEDVQAFAAQYANDQEMYTKMIAVNLEYRILRDNYPKPGERK